VKGIRTVADLRGFANGRLVAAALLAGALVAAGEQPAAAPTGSSAPGERVAASANQKVRQACRQGNLALLEAALAEKADADAAAPAGGLPPLLEMLRAAKAPLDPARRGCVACLLAHGAKGDATDSDRRTAVIYATRLGDLDTLRLLVEAGANVRTRDRFHQTALFYAIESKRRDIVRYLAQNGALISLSVKERRQMGERP
jgi:ankyrin repeat protein